MAEKKMLELCQLLRGKWPALHNIAIYHRLGEVKPKEASVVIAVSSQHRQASLESVQVRFHYLLHLLILYSRRKNIPKVTLGQILSDFKENDFENF